VLVRRRRERFAQRFDDVSPLSEGQREAFTLFESVPEEPGMAMEFRLEPGDSLIASIHTVIHGRPAFADAAEDASLPIGDTLDETASLDLMGGLHHSWRITRTQPTGESPDGNTAHDVCMNNAGEVKVVLTAPETSKQRDWET